MQINPRMYGASYYQEIQAIANKGVTGDQNRFFQKALTSGTSGSGSEFIPEAYSADIIMQIYEKNWARQLFGTHIVLFGMKENIPKFSTKVVESSGVSHGVDAIASELTSTTPIEKATMTTTEVELTLKTFAVCIEVQNKFLAYNASPQIEQRLKEAISQEIADSEEDCIINGDTDTTDSTNINYTYNASTNKHGVNTAAGDNEHLLYFMGLRHNAGATAVTNSGSAWTAAKMAEAYKNLGIYARQGREKLAFIVSPDLYAQMITWDELEGFDKYGPGATIISGEVGKFYGVSRVIVTDKMPNTASGTLTDSSGVRAASANLYTEWICVNTDNVLLGAPNNAERRLSIKKKDEPEYDRVLLIAVEDFGFVILNTTAICRGYYGTS